MALSFAGFRATGIGSIGQRAGGRGQKEKALVLLAVSLLFSVIIRFRWETSLQVELRCKIESEILLRQSVKTDSLFYRIFKQVPALFFGLIQQPYRSGYTFKSIEVKQTAFRIDGVFLPPANASEQPVFFLEVQFQKDPLLYNRLFSELFMFLEQNPNTDDWQAVVLFPRRSLEPPRSTSIAPCSTAPRYNACIWMKSTAQPHSRLPWN